MGLLPRETASGSNSRRCMAIAGVNPPRGLGGLQLSSVATSSTRRGKLGDDPGSPGPVHTVCGIGCMGEAI